jgi:dihydropteroate synthase
MNVFSQPFALMGIVNVTPDSFYDGGKFASTEKAVKQCMRLVD